MGMYIYHLTTKSRRIKVDAEPKDFYLLKFAGKDTSDRNMYTRLREARAERLANAWLGRPYPEYVVQGDFMDGAAVYTNWPGSHKNEIGAGYYDDGRKPETPYIEILETPSEADLAGFLRTHGKRLRFEKWHRYYQEFKTVEELREAQALLCDFMGGRDMLTTTSEQGFGPGPNLVVNYRDENDGVLIKTALG